MSRGHKDRAFRLNRLARGSFSRPTPITPTQREAIDLFNRMTAEFGREPGWSEWAEAYGRSAGAAEHMRRLIKERGYVGVES